MEYVIELESLSKSYGAKKVVDSFSLKMEKGHIYGLIGPNGAGKTTIMRMMAGLTRQDSGAMRFFGSDELDKKRERISFMIEEPYMDFDMSAKQNLEYKEPRGRTSWFFFDSRYSIPDYFGLFFFHG
ncbi:MAG: ATP-binding cassette domain-containing protein, partial [Lachnospiraceae bacterium]|nr:ATP-binding cassette domain-containing protein [Lachnospiraceae bacterium]